MKETVKLTRPAGFFPSFERKPGPNKQNMHYCPGCGHGVLHKLIAEAIADFGIKENVIMIAPVGCSVFVYYYFDCRTLQVAHGRAPAAATALSRLNPDDVVISYQGDGDLASIGFSHILQAANRGENMTVFFVNNAIYGMTGGQMAPTTLVGQKTTTSPWGRKAEEAGFPIRVSEIINTFEAPVYVERCSLANYKNIIKARMAVRKALKYQMEKKGFSFVEFLSACPINLKMSVHDANEFVDKQMSQYFPLGQFRDVAAERAPIERKKPVFEADAIKELLYPQEFTRAVDDNFQYKSPVFDKEFRVKISGFGGQGVLLLGNILAVFGKIRNFNVSWMPSYGPEMRGGTAACSVVFSKKPIGSPEAAHNPNILVCLNQPSIDKFLPNLSKNGVLIFDSSTLSAPKVADGQHAYAVPSAQIANDLGDLRMQNSVTLGAIAKIMKELYLNDEEKADFETAMQEALHEAFAKKPKAVEANIKAFFAGMNAVKKVN